MATFEQLMDAARRADAAGDTAAAKRFLELAQPMQAAPAATPEPTPAPVDEEQGLIDQIMGVGGDVADTAGYFSQELARGVTDLVGAPVDLVNASPMLLNLLPGEQGMQPFTEEPVGGSDHLWDMLTKPRDLAQEAIGSEVGDSTPDNMFERIGGRVMNELGAAAVPGAAIASKAAKVGTQGARTMQQSARPVERFTGRVLESAAANPAKFAGKEATYATGAGVGAGVAREAVSDGDPTTTTPKEAAADLVGALGGALGTGVVETVQRTGRDVLTAATGKGGSTVVRDAAAGELARAANAPQVPSGALDTEALADVLATGGRVSRTVPGFKETTGDVLQNPGVASLEYSRQSGANSGEYATRRQDNVRAANEAIEEQAPTGTPGAFRETLSQKRDDTLGEATALNTQARAEFDEAADALAAAQSGEARGQTVRAALDDALAKAKDVEREAWAGIDGEVDPSGLKAEFDAVEQTLTLAEQQAVMGDRGILNIPGELSKGPDEDAALMAQVFGDEAAPTATRLAEVTTLRSSLTDRARAARSAGDHNTARVLDKYVAAVDSFLDNAAPAVVEQMEAARAVTRDLNDRFTRPGTPVAETLSRNQGQPRLPDSRVTQKFVQPDEGQATNVDTLLRETNNAQDVREALEDQIRAGAQGLLDSPDRLEKYLGQYEQVFKKFPELRDEFGTAASLKRTSDEAASSLKATERDLGTPETQGTGTVGKYLKFGDERSVDAMAGVVNAPDPAKAIDELMEFSGGDAQAVEGARSAFWQLMRRDAQSTGSSTKVAGGEQTWRPQSLYNFLQDPKKRVVMERLYADDPEQMARVDEIAKALNEVDLRSSTKAPNSSGTPQAIKGNEVLPSTETVGAYSFAYQRGQVGLPFIGLRLVSTMARKATLKGRTAEFEQLIDEALLNPEVAEMLLREHNPANVAAMTRSAKLWWGNRANALVELMEGEPTEDESLVDTIMEGQ